MKALKFLAVAAFAGLVSGVTNDLGYNGTSYAFGAIAFVSLAGSLIMYLNHGLE